MAFSNTSSAAGKNLATDYFPGYLYLTSEASGNEITTGTSIVNGTDYVLIPRTAIHGLDAAESHLTTGNGNKLFYGLLKTANDAWEAAGGDQPATLNFSEGLVNGASATTYRQSITVQALFDLTGADIADETA